MIYKAAQIEHWPRLLTAARAIDPTLTDALQALMMQGASLQLTQSGKLQIGAGTMPAEAYEAVKADKLLPRREKLYRLLGTARGLGHPWLQAVAAAYKDVNERCAKGMKALLDAGTKGDTKAWLTAVPALAERHYQAGLLAQALLNAGFGQYDKAVSEHHVGYADRATDARKAGLPDFPLTPDAPPRAWPVNTPDGWLWVCDIGHYQGQPWIPPAAAGKAWLDGEPLITDQQLANALARAEDPTAQRREAG